MFQTIELHTDLDLNQVLDLCFLRTEQKRLASLEHLVVFLNTVPTRLGRTYCVSHLELEILKTGLDLRETTNSEVFSKWKTPGARKNTTLPIKNSREKQVLRSGYLKKKKTVPTKYWIIFYLVIWKHVNYRTFWIHKRSRVYESCSGFLIFNTTSNPRAPALQINYA